MSIYKSMYIEMARYATGKFHGDAVAILLWQVAT